MSQHVYIQYVAQLIRFLAQNNLVGCRNGTVVSFLPCLVALWGFHHYMHLFSFKKFLHTNYSEHTHPGCGRVHQDMGCPLWASHRVQGCFSRKGGSVSSVAVLVAVAASFLEFSRASLFLSNLHWSFSSAFCLSSSINCDLDFSADFFADDSSSLKLTLTCWMLKPGLLACPCCFTYWAICVSCCCFFFRSSSLFRFCSSSRCFCSFSLLRRFSSHFFSCDKM